MTRIHKWSEFDDRARTIFANRPDSTRFSIKQTTRTREDKEGNIKKKVCVILKVTNDVDTVSYHTTERNSNTRISALMKWFSVKMISTSYDELKDETGLKAKLRE
jgi:hypothetical protein